MTSASAAEGGAEAEDERPAAVALPLLLSLPSLSCIALFALAAFAAHSPALAPGTDGPATPLAEITAPLAPSEAALSEALAAVVPVAAATEPATALVLPLILLTSVPQEGHFAAVNLATHEAEGTPPDHIPASQTLPCSSSVAPA